MEDAYNAIGGTVIDWNKPPTITPHVENELAIARVIALIRDDPELAQRIARQVGHELFREPLDAAVALPEGWHRAELTLSDRGPPKKGTKPSRPPVRYKALMKFEQFGGEKIKALWKPTVELRTPAVFEKKLPDYLTGGKCQTPFDADQEAFVREALKMATNFGYLIGIPSTKPRALGGTHFVMKHVLLVDPSFESALLVVRTPKGDRILELPKFSTEYADGSNIAANTKNGNDFIMQSRALISTRPLTPAYTGHAIWLSDNED